MIAIIILLLCFSIIAVGGIGFFYLKPKLDPPPDTQGDEDITDEVPDEEEDITDEVPVEEEVVEKPPSLEKQLEELVEESQKSQIVAAEANRQETTRVATAGEAASQARQTGNELSKFKQKADADKKAVEEAAAKAMAAKDAADKAAKEAKDETDRVKAEEAAAAAAAELLAFAATKKKAEEDAAAVAAKVKALQDKMREEARAAADAAKKAEAAKKEKARKDEENRQKQLELQKKAEQLKKDKEWCEKGVWQNVYIGTLIHPFDRAKTLDTRGQSYEAGNAKVLFGNDKITRIYIRTMTGRDRRGTPQYQWQEKAKYNGIVKLDGDTIGYDKLVKRPMNKQPQACRRNTRACAYDNDGFEEIHNFDDPLLEHKYLLMVYNNYAGVMQGDTGKFYSFSDKKVIDNPFAGNRCVTEFGIGKT